MTDYTYNIARVRSKEIGLLTAQDIEQLINSRNYSESLRILHDKGYENDGDVIAAATRELWAFLNEIADGKLLKFIQLPIDYHNVKAAVKSIFSNIDGKALLLDYGAVDKAVIYNAVKNGAYNELPQPLAEAAEKAMSLILRTQDSQLCDIELDKAELCEQWQIAEDLNDDFIKRYISLKVRLDNIKTAFRCAVMGKSESFTEYALCDNVQHSIHRLAVSAEKGVDALIEYLESSGEGEAAEAMKKSASELEKWCDDKIMALMQEVRYSSSGMAPIMAYAYAKAAEIKAVRLILSAKQNKIENIRERVRQLYV